jgi:hypothetical protein
MAESAPPPASGVSVVARLAQEVILWRSPAAVLATFAVTESAFYLAHRADLGFLAGCFLACTIAAAVRLLYAVNGAAFEAILIADHPADEADRPNRIREWRELAPHFAAAAARLTALRRWLCASPARVFGALFPAFVLGTWPGARAILFVAVHAALLVPGAALHPGVRAYAGGVLERARQRAAKAE